MVYRDRRPEDVLEAVQGMIDVQRHRGPDGEGYFHGEGVVLGHCRLAIIDLSAAGHQPMSDPTGRFWLTYNGEIYNHQELRRELVALGYEFLGNSDSEVLLTAFREWGAECVGRLRGMFAFAIWDTKRRCLFAARDRLGIKPFHYCFDGSTLFAFASEIKGLRPFLPKRLVNEQRAREYLAWNLLDHDAVETMWTGVNRLPAGHTLAWALGSPLEVRRYWSIAFNDRIATTHRERIALQREFRERFEETVSLHLRSDVPVGTCLSGGLDSSAIVCVASEELRRNGISDTEWQHVFSACFDDPSLDERPYIQSVVQSTGCVPHYVFPNGETLREDLGKWLWHQEEPVGGTGAYAHFCVARLAREGGIKVLLDGQGADEQLAGYRKFIPVYLRQLFRHGHFGKAVQEAVAFFTSPEILRTIDFVEGRRYLSNSLNEIDRLFADGIKPELPSDFGLVDSLAQRLESDLLRYSLPVLLRYEDRNTMAFGIEARVPFVDHRLVEWMAALPADMRLRNGWTKIILREALRSVLPPKIARRKTKLGFSTPEAAWMAGPMSPWLRQTLDRAEILHEFVAKDGLRHLFARFLAGERSRTLLAILFRLATFEVCAQRFLNGQRGS
ncbi:MAG: asparagine synthase (glutamine-hydrolyzing) [Acidobacteria bacterium]|nr:asparagine synthase (glutamine-hydrolyzing) [Acidobacteriota bacterium]